MNLHIHDAIRINADNSLEDRKTDQVKPSLKMIVNEFKTQVWESRSIIDSSLLTIEIRTVITLFIRLDVNTSMTTIDHTDEDTGEILLEVDDNGFLVRSELQVDSDNELLLIFQNCFDTISRYVCRLSGQIRQFILDDKGTICIASFGLRKVFFIFIT